jgi:hypothetical protein
MDTLYQTIHDKRSDEELFELVSTIYDVVNNKTRSRRGSYYLGNQEQVISYVLEEGHHSSSSSVSLHTEMLHRMAHPPRHHLIPTMDSPEIADHGSSHENDDEEDDSSSSSDEGDTEDIRDVVENILLKTQIDTLRRNECERRYQERKKGKSRKSGKKPSNTRLDGQSLAPSERLRVDSFESSNTTSTTSLSSLSTKFTKSRNSSTRI